MSTTHTSALSLVRPVRAPRRTKAEQAEFYERVVQTSLQLFAEGGCEAISMRKLASEVGVPPMSLYRYFPTKAHLMRHVWDHVFERAHEHSTAQLVRARTPLDRLLGYLDGFMQYWLEHTDHYWVVFSFQGGMGRGAAEDDAYGVDPVPRRFLHTLEELLGACLPPGSLPAQQARHLLDSIFCKVLGFLLGTIGLAALRWPDVQGMKSRLLDEVALQLRQAGEASAGKTSRPRARAAGRAT